MQRFVTTYSSDYQAIERGFQYPSQKQKPSNRPTIGEEYPFITECEQNAPDLTNPVDVGNEYLRNKFTDDKPKLANLYFKTPMDKDVIKAELRKGSIYAKDYCDFKRPNPKSNVNYEIMITEKVETTMNDHYRDPNTINKVPPYKAAKPEIPTLTANHYVITSILKAKPSSEYQRLIGHTGKLIIENEFLGKMSYPNV